MHRWAETGWLYWLIGIDWFPFFVLCDLPSTWASMRLTSSWKFTLLIIPNKDSHSTYMLRFLHFYAKKRFPTKDSWRLIAFAPFWNKDQWPKNKDWHISHQRNRILNTRLIVLREILGLKPYCVSNRNQMRKEMVSLIKNLHLRSEHLRWDLRPSACSESSTDRNATNPWRSPGTVCRG